MANPIVSLFGITPSQYTAVLSGSIIPSGSATTASFQWGLDKNYGSITSSNLLVSGNVASQFLVTINSLVPETVYHVKLIASSSAPGNTGSADTTFNTTGFQIGGVREVFSHDIRLALKMSKLPAGYVKYREVLIGQGTPINQAKSIALNAYLAGNPSASSFVDNERFDTWDSM